MIEKDYWNNTYQERSVVSACNSHKFALREFCKGAKNVDFHGEVLEIGAGEGLCSIMVKQDNDVTITESDYSDKALVLGKKIAGFAKVNIDHFVSCDINNMPFEDGYFDVIFCNSVLHHLEDLDSGLKEIHRVLKSHGTFYASGEPSATDLIQKIIVITNSQPIYEVKDRIYSFRKWEQSFVNAGFKPRIAVSKDPHNKQRTLSYAVACVSNFIPDAIIKKLFASSIYIYAEKI